MVNGKSCGFLQKFVLNLLLDCCGPAVSMFKGDSTQFISEVDPLKVCSELSVFIKFKSI